jgi:arginyl-tRNA synthetase
MADLHALLAARLTPAFAAVAGDDDADPVVRPSDRADAQANGALPLAKRLGRNPREVAADIVATADLAGVASAEVAGPGFINLNVDGAFLAATLAEMVGGERLGIPAQPGRRCLVDYSAPNIAKELHIGHMRSTVIGDAVVRLLEFLGHDVVRENHIGDWGRPFGILIEHLVESGAAERDDLTLDETGELYKVATQRFADDPAFAERARARVVALQRHEPDTMAIWRRLTELSEADWQQVYAKLGVLLTVDDVVGESFYHDKMPDVLERLEAAGLVQESDGALVVFPPGFTNRDGEPLPLIVRSSAGAMTYAMSDLACVVDRVERVKAELLLYVVGAPQAQHLAMVFAVSEMAGWLQPPAEAVHVPFGHVLGPDGKMMRSRSGDPVSLNDVVDEAIERGTAAVAAKNPELPAELRRTIGHAVGVGALKYADLSTDRVRDYVFDWDRMLSFDGNTAPYLQYAHTRICSLFRRAGVDRGDLRGAALLVGEPQERALARRLLGYEAAVLEAAARCSPHRLCTYLFELATDFTAFYEHCPVLKAPSDDVRASRLALSDLTARVLAHGLGLLGIAAPEQM